jgi:hypothetical protein
LKPTDSVTTAIALNWWVVLGIMFGTGAQGYLSASAKERGCRVRHAKSVTGGTGFFSAVLSIISFLSLIPVGCCGTWLYVLSFAPTLFGSSFAALLIERSFELKAASLLVVLLLVAYTYYSTRKASLDPHSRTGVPPEERQSNLPFVT